MRITPLTCVSILVRIRISSPSAISQSLFYLGSLDSLPEQSVTGVGARMIGSTANNISNLRSLSKESLRELWQATFKKAPSPRLRREVMLPVLACRMQEQSRHNLTVEAQMLLNQVIGGLKRATGQPGVGFRSGTRLVREWKGQVHEVLVKEDGFEYQGEHFKSLSPIACRITGTRWSGPAFFGTKGRK
jgi:hypothetical protein